MPLNQSQFKKFEKQLIGILAQRLPNPTGQTLSYRVKKTAAFLGVAENPKSKKAKKLVKQTGVCYRNDQKWETIKTQFEHFSPQGEKKTYTVVHNPAGQLMLGAHDIFPVDYKGKGICSGTTDCIEHATNLYTAELTDEHNQSLLKVVRHGICSPYGIKHDPELREQGALNRAREVVSAALFLQLGPEALQRALEQNQVIELNAFSNSLVTPADFFKDTEGTQLMDQMKAFDRLKHAPDKEPIKLTLTDRDGNLRTVQLRLTMPTFNWGVNPAALKLNLAGVDLTGSWEVADAYNKLGMIDVFGEKTVEQFSPTVIDTVRTNISQLTKKSNEPEPVEPLELDGMVGRYLNKKPAPDNTALVTQLSEQILQIWQKKLYRVDKGDPYKMAARMILLGSEIDGISCINCKSGKDRTGKAYEEAARLKIWVSLGKGLPPIDYEFTHEEKKLLDTIAANSGNAEIQIQNTGLPGNKVLNPSLLGSSNADRFPDRQKAVHAATLSGLVSS